MHIHGLRRTEVSGSKRKAEGWERHAPATVGVHCMLTISSGCTGLPGICVRACVRASRVSPASVSLWRACRQSGRKKTHLVLAVRHADAPLLLLWQALCARDGLLPRLAARGAEPGDRGRAREPVVDVRLVLRRRGVALDRVLLVDLEPVRGAATRFERICMVRVGPGGGAGTHAA